MLNAQSFRCDGLIMIPARTQGLIVGSSFEVNTSSGARVKIDSIKPNFIETLGHLIEPPEAMREVEYFTNLRHFEFYDLYESFRVDRQKYCETTLTDIYELLLQQPNGGAGVLNNRGMANIFFVRDLTQDICIVIVEMSFRGWAIKFYHFEKGDWCWAGQRIFVRVKPKTLSDRLLSRRTRNSI